MKKFNLNLEQFIGRVECKQERPDYDPSVRGQRQGIKIYFLQDEKIPVRMPPDLVSKVVRVMSENMASMGFSECHATAGHLEGLVHDLRSDIDFYNGREPGDDTPTRHEKVRVTCKHPECLAAEPANQAANDKIKNAVIPAALIEQMIGKLDVSPGQNVQ